MRKKSYSSPLHSLEISGHVECKMQVAVFIADIRGSAISSRKSFLCVAGKAKKAHKTAEIAGWSPAQQNITLLNRETIRRIITTVEHFRSQHCLERKRVAHAWAMEYV